MQKSRNNDEVSTMIRESLKLIGIIMTIIILLFGNCRILLNILKFNINKYWIIIRNPMTLLEYYNTLRISIVYVLELLIDW